MKKSILLLFLILPILTYSQITISNLNEATSLNSTDLFLLTQGASSKKLKFNTLQYKLFNTIPFPLRLNYAGDSLRLGFSGDTARFQTSQLYYSLDKDLYIKGVKVTNSGGSIDTSKLVSKFDLQNGLLINGDINLLSNNLFYTVTGNNGFNFTSTRSFFGLNDNYIIHEIISPSNRQVTSRLNDYNYELKFRGYRHTTATDFSIQSDTSGTTWLNDFSQVAKIDSSGNASFTNVDVTGDLTINSVSIGHIYATGGGDATHVTGTEGSVFFIMPNRYPYYKNVIIRFDGFTGSATYTFPVAFTWTAPQILSQSNSDAVTSISSTSVTVTGTNRTGLIELNGY